MRALGILVILLLFVGGATAFNDATPYRTAGALFTQRNPETNQPATAPDIGAPDERQHANYVARMARGEGPAVLDPKDPELYENYQAHQPPLYYFMAGQIAKAAGWDPQANEGGRYLRFVNTGIGVLMLLGMFAFARNVSQSDEVALAAMAFGLLPMNLALHGAVSNDPLLYCLIAWALVLAAIVARGSGAAYPILFGLVAGAAIWTKTTGLMLIPVGMVAGYIGAPKKSKFTVALTMGLGPLLVAAPWMIRNVQVYGDPFALRAFTESFGGTAQAMMFIDSIGMGSYLMNWVGWTAAKSFVGTFGYMDISPLEAYGAKAVETFYRVSLAFLTAAGLSGLIAVAKDRKKPQPAMHALGAVAVLVVLALFLRFNLQYFQGQSRYLYPAFAPLALLMGMGVTLWFKKREQWAWVCVAVVMAGFAFASWSTLGPAFARRIEMGQAIQAATVPEVGPESSGVTNAN